MKKSYGVVDVDQKEIAAAASGGGGTQAVPRPLVKIDDGADGKGYNAKIIAGEFEFPDAHESKESTLEIAIRVLGILVTKELLPHLPAEVTGEHVGMLLPYLPIAYHKRFGATYTDRVCPSSTRNGRCPACDGRIELFKHKNAGECTKDDIMDAGFGTKGVGLVVARIFFDGEDLGVRVFKTALTNPNATKARYENFFDLIDQLMTPKKMLAGETLPKQYYANGDDARWLIAEYVKAVYQDDGTQTQKGEQKSKRPPRPYWKLSKITPTKEIPKLGKAENIWWPEIGKKDSIELVDIHGLVNYTDPAELADIARQSVEFILKPKEYGTRKEAAAAPTGQLPAGGAVEKPTWSEILAMTPEELVQIGTAFGGDQTSLELVAAANVAALRRSVTKLCGVTPQATKPSQDTAGDDNVDLDRQPF